MGEELCHICNDKSTGKHYGAVSCDGCKGFFRRSIRKRYHYVCRFEKACDVTKNKRNACRACRLQKCVKAGMKANAIQNERDAIGKRKKTPVVENEELADQLVAAETMCQQLRSSVIKRTEKLTYDCGKIPVDDDNAATLEDIGKSIHQQLVLLVEWAKSLPQFSMLPISDQAALLKYTASVIIVIGVAYRSSSIATEDAICLANDSILTKQQATHVGDLNCVVQRIIEEIVKPMKKLKMDLIEYVMLKAILFFNPVVSELQDRTSVEATRTSLMRSLQKRCAEKAQVAMSDDDDSDIRISHILLLLPSIQALAQQLKEDVQLARLFGLVNVDSLMIELILDDQKRSDPKLLETISSPVQSIKAEINE